MGHLGNSIEDYHVYEALGRGGFAVVHRAQCKATGMEVAIKKIEIKRITAAGMVNRVNQEVAIHSRLNHPSILKLYTFFEDRYFVYLVLELCHNGELQKFLKTTHRVLSESEACSILKQVVEGLLYLHSHQIIHRDITLSNLLLTREMNVKIADFGLATQLQRPDEKHMTMCGTPNYISPEVATRASHGLETDVWGLGILLYTCLVGNPPFDTEDGLKSTLTRVVMSEIKFPSSISSEAKDLITSLLKKNPKERIKLSKILDHPFVEKANLKILNNPLQRCVSYDSGVVSGSYTTSQGVHSYTNAIMGHLYQSNRPTSPCSMKQAALSVCNEPLGYNNHSYDKMCSHICPQTHTSAPSFGHSLVPNRIQPVPPVAQQYSAFENKKVSSQCGNLSCSHAWRQCNQCSHIDTCGCINLSQKASSLPKTADNLEDKPREGKASVTEKTHRGQADNNGILQKSREGLQMKPINSNRLRPVRQKTKNVVVSITNTGEVCLEFIKLRESHEKVVEVMRISSDGMRIILYQPKKGRGVTLTDSPPPLPSTGADAIYSYENIPEKHWKKYSYAYKFIDLVKSKTPKITYYSSKAKCFLMENLPEPDFEVCFYEGGKISKSQSHVNFTDVDGKVHTFEYFDDSYELSRKNEFLWEHFKQCYQHCTSLNEAMENLSVKSEQTCFPAVIGKRPSSHNPLSNLNANKENVSPQSAIVSIPKMREYESSILSSKVHHKEKTSKLLKQVIIPTIGKVVQFTNGEIHVNYKDSSKLIVNSSSAEVAFTDSSGNYSQYKQNDLIPQSIRNKLSQMPVIFKELLNA